MYDVGSIHDIKPAAEIIKQMVDQVCVCVDVCVCVCMMCVICVYDVMMWCVCNDVCV